MTTRLCSFPSLVFPVLVGDVAFLQLSRIFDHFAVIHQLEGQDHDVVKPEPMKAVKEHYEAIIQEIDDFSAAYEGE